MSKESVLKQMKFIRERTIALLDATSEELADEMPKGFRNNLRWQFGHIATSQENLIGYFLGLENTLPKSFTELFNRGTSPADWNQDVPTLVEIKALLKEQYERMLSLSTGRLEEEGSPLILGPEYKYETLAEAIDFTNFHEALHQGNIISLKRALGVEDLWAVEETSK
ncbi:DinB family protein [Ornithinibacillus californiensis]|uniref:DinB family protein n=1 Tax=Ornithinibacillus californiensis TaxID=161536 RepID=UPI00069EA04C|nr:DinB family protein [Ornithinibacillus californiensis]